MDHSFESHGHFYHTQALQLFFQQELQSQKKSLSFSFGIKKSRAVIEPQSARSNGESTIGLESNLKKVKLQNYRTMTELKSSYVRRREETMTD
jgi:hypothetical protein